MIYGRSRRHMTLTSETRNPRRTLVEPRSLATYGSGELGGQVQAPILMSMTEGASRPVRRSSRTRCGCGSSGRAAVERRRVPWNPVKKA